MGVTVKLFKQEGCSPCSALAFIMENEGIDVELIDIEENKDITDEYDVLTVPTTIVEKDGEVVKRYHGMFNVSELKGDK